jgi:transcriptional regulator with PAS, ATPase and Fis domain
LLTRKFLEKYYDVNKHGFIEKTRLDLLMRYPIPATSRELKIHTPVGRQPGSGEPIRENHLPLHIINSPERMREGGEVVGGERSSVKPLAEVEKVHILHAYRQTGKNKSKTARLLGSD